MKTKSSNSTIFRFHEFFCCTFFDFIWTFIDFLTHCDIIKACKNFFRENLVWKKKHAFFSRNNRIEFTLKNITDLLRENIENYWWGPKHFIFDKITFYQIVYKKYDEYTKKNKILFWIWANLPQKEANRYSYEIHLESDRPPDPKYQMRHWKGTGKIWCAFSRKKYF